MVKVNKDFYKKISKIGLKKRWKEEHKKVIIRKRLTKEKIGIHAYLCGDGWISRRKNKRGTHYEIRIYPDDLILAEFIVSLFEKEFKIQPKIRTLRNHFNVEIKNKPACLNLLKLGPYGTYNWKIPKKLPRDFLIEWLRCFFDCESNVDIKNKKIALKSVNFSGLKEILKTLRDLKINGKLYGPYQPKNKKHAQYGMILITKENIHKYKRLINFHHPVKKDKLEKI